MLSKGQNRRDQMEMVWLEELVPENHLLRLIDGAVDFSKIYEMVEGLYCEDNGRPSIDPVVSKIFPLFAVSGSVLTH